jgi:hypothetical protein
VKTIILFIKCTIQFFGTQKVTQNIVLIVILNLKENLDNLKSNFIKKGNMNDYEYLKINYPRLRKKTVNRFHYAFANGWKIVKTKGLAKNEKIPALIYREEI